MWCAHVGCGAQGGSVRYNQGAMRVNGSLAVSRAFGDRFLSKCGVTAHPGVVDVLLPNDAQVQTPAERLN